MSGRTNKFLSILRRSSSPQGTSPSGTPDDQRGGLKKRDGITDPESAVLLKHYLHDLIDFDSVISKFRPL
jgi:hypothetical protein